MISEIVKLIVGSAWPAAFVFGIWIFREPIKTLLSRVGTVKVGPQGVEISGPPQPLETPASASEQGVSPTLPATIKAGPNAPSQAIAAYYAAPFQDLIEETEKQVDASLPDIAARYNKNSEDTLKHLYIEYFAALNLERASRFLLGSQVDSINFIVANAGKATKEQIRPYYAAGSVSLPLAYANYSFDQWLSFLVVHNLVQIDGDEVMITPAGKAIVPYMQGRGYLHVRPVG